jgi:hypothetical protein
MNGPVFPNEDTSPVGKLREPAAAAPPSAESPVVELSSAVPNAPSEPVWSLSPEPGAALPEHRNLHAAHSATADAVGVAASESVGSVSGSPAEITDEKETEDSIQIPEDRREPAQPPRRGWWQRPFRARE